jgi:hypothetical protein
MWGLTEQIKELRLALETIRESAHQATMIPPPIDVRDFLDEIIYMANEALGADRASKDDV